MNWRLLDIRIGRANRQQFWLVFLLFIGVNYILSLLGTMFQWPLLAISSYLLILILLRRMRDMNMASEDGLLMLREEPTHNINYMKIRLPNTHANPLLIFWALFVSGNKLKNDFGYPPEGLNLNSMIADNYSPAQKQEAKESQRTQYKTKFTYEDMNETNGIKPRGKAP